MTNSHHGRDARPILPEDLESAKRGLRMWSRTTAWLRDEAEAHDKIDAFASAVIAAACREVIAERKLG